MVRLCAGASVFSIFMTAATFSSAQHTLDLTTIPEPSSSEDSVTFDWIHLSHGNPTIPVEVTLVDIDRRTYALGSPVVFTVRVKNVGAVPLVLPWVPWKINHAALAQSATRDQLLLAGHLSLITLDGDGHLLWILGVGELEGTRAVPESVQLLAPGETADIRVPDSLQLGSSELRQKILGSRTRATIAVRAAFDMTVERRLLSERVVSSNSIDIVLNDSTP